MTIPSRPAPPPPQQSVSQQNVGGSHITIKLPPPPTGNNTHLKYGKPLSQSTRNTENLPSAKTRYAPSTNWDGAPFELLQQNPIEYGEKKIPPPRPPPPKVLPGIANGAVLKKPGPPQSVNVLSNLFGKKKYAPKKPYPPKVPAISLQVPINQAKPNMNAIQSLEAQLISFDSPPSSPTLTQKSNSDCVSVDSFSSDSNFSSPHNGRVSQPESGFEDDFTSPPDPFDSLSNDPYADITTIHNDMHMKHPVRNINAMYTNQTDDPLNNGKSLLPPQTTLAMPTIIRPKVPQNLNTSSMMNQNISRVSKPTSIFQSESNDVTYDDLGSSLPMPKCPPPPPPPEANSITYQLDDTDLFNTPAEESSYGIALYDFDGLEDGDLSFKINEKLYIIQQLNDEWYLGRNRCGCEGMFPSNYIEVKVPLGSSKISSMNSNSNIKWNTTNVPKISPHKVKVLYNFEAETIDDLSLKENDLVTVLYKINEDWLYGELDNRRGQFPANFLEYIPKNLLQK